MSEPIDLKRLAEPFHPDDIEWRVSRSWLAKGKIYCLVLAYITARAIQNRLDEVCGQANWQIAQPLSLNVNAKNAFAVGISIRINGEWITKWDVAEPTAERGAISAPAKGGFSGAMKRAGAQWGIGRYLYYLDETFAETSEEKPAKETKERWTYAELKDDKGSFFWKEPNLPGWALPKPKELEITKADLDALKQAWRKKFAPETKNSRELAEGFSRFVGSVVGESFPSSDFTLWTRDALERCHERIEKTTDPNGIDPNIPFES